MDGLRVGMVNDLHYGWPDDRDPERYLEPVLEELVDRLNGFSPDLVVGLGDYIEHQDRTTDRANLERVGEILSGIDAPLYAVPGNHDVVTLGTDAVMDALDPVNDEPRAVLDRGDARLVLLDTTHRDADLSPVGGVLGREQRDWLRGALDTDRDVYLFAHHMLHHRDVADTTWFSTIPELAPAVDRFEVRDDLSRAAAAFNAHIHDADVTRFDGVPHVTLHAVNKARKEAGTDRTFGRLVVGGEAEFHSGFQSVDL